MYNDAERLVGKTASASLVVLSIPWSCADRAPGPRMSNTHVVPPWE